MKSREDLGERKIIEIIQSHLDLLPKMPVPFGDDVSAFDIGNETLAVLKTDMLVDKTDVPPKMSFWQAARKAVVMNISDFAAKGVKPLAILVSLGLPEKLKERNIKNIGAGLNAGAREYGAYVIGGDTNEASDLIISISLFGIARKEEVMLRSGAKPGDIVAVTGFFGKTAAGLKILVEGFKASAKIREALIKPVLMPKARLDEGLALSRTRTVTASIDSSDSLAWSLHELSKASNVGFLIENIPIDDETVEFANINGLDPFELAFYGGEEYELVLTIKRRLWNKAEKAVKNVGGNLIKIGRATADKQIIFDVEGRRRIIEPRGWEHFRRH